DLGIDVTQRIPTGVHLSAANVRYLSVKASHTGRFVLAACCRGRDGPAAAGSVRDDAGDPGSPATAPLERVAGVLMRGQSPRAFAQWRPGTRRTHGQPTMHVRLSRV
ncbi:hypothetical protein AB0I88_38245, partial [Actinoplanes sp. NPDC049802]